MKHFVHQIAALSRMRKKLFVLAASAVVLGGLCLGAALLGIQAGPPARDAARPDATDSAPAEAGAYGPDALRGLTVAVDPGHGGYDGGARCHDSGLWEKSLNLQIALRLETALRAYGADVALTRREDVALGSAGDAGRARKRADLQARRDAATAAGADLLLSIHMNEYRARAESGPQTFYQRGADEGRLLAGAIQQALLDGLNPPKRRVAMAGNYYVLRGELPSALVECGFISNAAEERLLLDPGYQARVAEAIARGVCEYAALRSLQGQ